MESIVEVNRTNVENELESYFEGQPAALAAALSEVDSFFTEPSYVQGLSRSTGIDDPQTALLFWSKKRGRRWQKMLLTRVR